MAPNKQDEHIHSSPPFSDGPKKAPRQPERWGRSGEIASCLGGKSKIWVVGLFLFWKYVYIYIHILYYIVIFQETLANFFV